MVNLEHQTAVVAELQRARYPGGTITKANVWLGMIQVMCWYDFGFLHIIDSDKLNPTGLGRKTKSKGPRYDGPWQLRARAAEAEILRRLGLPPAAAPDAIGLMWRNAWWADCETGNQKANPVGNALRYLGAYAMQEWGNTDFGYLQEQPLKTYFPGFSIPGVHTPAADVLVTKHVGSTPVADISCKWSMRTDRVSECHKECAHVKSAALQSMRSRSFKFYVLCHEYDPARIAALLSDECIDGVALVNLPILEAIGLADRLRHEIAAGRLLSLEQLIDASSSW
jgi:hypothetical protein